MCSRVSCGRYAHKSPMSEGDWSSFLYAMAYGCTESEAFIH